MTLSALQPMPAAQSPIANQRLAHAHSPFGLEETPKRSFDRWEQRTDLVLADRLDKRWLRRVIA
jgi:hypothetical protein